MSKPVEACRSEAVPAPAHMRSTQIFPSLAWALALTTLVAPPPAGAQTPGVVEQRALRAEVIRRHKAEVARRLTEVEQRMARDKSVADPLRYRPEVTLSAGAPSEKVIHSSLVEIKLAAGAELRADGAIIPLYSTPYHIHAHHYGCSLLAPGDYVCSFREFSRLANQNIGIFGSWANSLQPVETDLFRRGPDGNWRNLTISAHRARQLGDAATFSEHYR